jgi:hypothetical protein
MTNLTMPARTVDGRPSGIGGLARAATILFGAMVALQSSQDLSVVKIGYLAAATLAVIGSVWTVHRRRADHLVEFARPWLIASLVVASLVGVSLPVAVLHGTTFSAWLRDAAAYALLAAAPWVALDLALSVTRRATVGLILIAGGLATLSYAIVWVQRRTIADIAIDRLALPSFMLATALFAFAVAQSVADENRRYRWAALASMSIALLLLAGTRTTLAILIVPIAVLGTAWLSDPDRSLQKRLVPALLPLITAATIVASTQVGRAIDLGSVFGPQTSIEGSDSSPGGSGAEPDSEILGGRFDTFGSVLTGRDASLQDRIAQTRAAWDSFLTSPLIGNGLGVVVTWTRTSGRLQTEFTADTPVLVLAKFGVLGFVIVGIIGGAWIITIRRLRPGGEITQVSRLTLVGYGAATVVLTPFGWQLEDKGTGLALIVLLALAFTEARQANILRGPKIFATQMSAQLSALAAVDSTNDSR